MLKIDTMWTKMSLKMFDTVNTHSLTISYRPMFTTLTIFCMLIFAVQLINMKVDGCSHLTAANTNPIDGCYNIISSDLNKILIFQSLVLA
jgi:hypothetical protein